MLLNPLIVARVTVMITFLVPHSPQSLDTHAGLPFGVVIHHIIQLTCVYLKITTCVRHYGLSELETGVLWWSEQAKQHVVFMSVSDVTVIITIITITVVFYIRINKL